MKHLIAALILLVPLLGCRMQSTTSHGRYVLYVPFPEAPAQDPPGHEPSKETIVTELNRIKACLLAEDEVKRHNGRCVVENNGTSVSLTFDDRDWMLNVRLNVYPIGELGGEQVSPRWIVVDTKMHREHRWFYTPSCPVREDQMWQIMKTIYGL